MTLTYENPVRSANPVGADWLFATDFVSKVFWLCLNGFVVAAVLYQLLFNLIDDGLRTSIAGGLGIIAVARCLFSWSRPSGLAATLLFVGLAFLIAFCFFFLMDQSLVTGSVYAERSLRLLTGYAIFLLFAFARRMVSPTFLILSCIATVIAATLIAATSPWISYAEIMRPATFTGGEEGVHSTAYVLTATFLGILTLWRLGRLATASVVLMGAPLLTLIVLFGVRTCWLMILCYLIVATFIRMRKGHQSGYWITVPILLGIASIGVWLSSAVVDYSEFSEFSSGRSDAYSERLEIIANRPPVTLLFGTGVGSEMMKSTVWWWEDKNSHNDFIDITIQMGIVGLVLTIAMVCLAAAQLDKYQLPLFLSFVISSAFSNGLLGRPFIAALLLSFMAVPATIKKVRGTRK